MLVHVGYHKCGSSWLQRNLFNRTDCGFYPVCPELKKDRTGKSKYLSEFFIYDQDGYILSPFQNRTEEIRASYETISINSSDYVPVVSSERLSGNPHAGGFDSKCIARRIADAFPEAKILIMIREQTRILVSNYFQYLKSGGHRHYQHYFQTLYDGGRPGFSPSFFEFHNLISLYQELFGEQNVLSIPLEYMLSERQSFVECLRSFSGADINTELPFDSPAKKGLPRYVELKTRHLNLLRRSNSLNGYAINTSGTWEKQIFNLRKAMNKFVPTSLDQGTIHKIHRYVSIFFDGYYRDSNVKTEKIIGIPLREKYDYM